MQTHRSTHCPLHLAFHSTTTTNNNPFQRLASLTGVDGWEDRGGGGSPCVCVCSSAHGEPFSFSAFPTTTVRFPFHRSQITSTHGDQSEHHDDRCGKGPTAVLVLVIVRGRHCWESQRVDFFWTPPSHTALGRSRTLGPALRPHLLTALRTGLRVACVVAAT